MSNIRKRTNKDGVTTYQIRVFRGNAPDGTQLKPYTMTYKPREGKRCFIGFALQESIAFKWDIKRDIGHETGLNVGQHSTLLFFFIFSLTEQRPAFFRAAPTPSKWYRAGDL